MARQISEQHIFIQPQAKRRFSRKGMQSARRCLSVFRMECDVGSQVTRARTSRTNACLPNTT